MGLPTTHSLRQLKLPLDNRRGLAAAAVACVLASGLAMGAGVLLRPWLDDNLVVVFAFPAVVACSVLFGLVSGLATAVLCALWALFAAAEQGGSSAVLQASAFLVAGSAVAVVTALVAERDRPARAEAAPPAPGDADAFTLSWLRAGVVLSVLVPWALFGAFALYTHKSAMEAAERRMDRLAAIAHEHALKLFETADLLIQQVNSLSQTMDPDALRRDQGALTARLADLTRGMSHVHAVWMVDAQGRAVLSSRPNSLSPDLSETGQRALRTHAAEAGRLLLAPPRTGRQSQQLFFDVSRRRETADGRFNGMTVVGLYPSYFTEFYRDLADSEQGITLTLVQTDGAVVARWPAPLEPSARLHPDSPLLAAMRRGQVLGHPGVPSHLDGMERIGTFRQVGRYPAYVYAGSDERAALAGWRRDLRVLAAFILPLSVGLALICFQALQRTRKHIEAARALRREALERQRVEAALRQSQKLEAMGHLTGGVAHDFNNLLMVVNLNVTLLRQRLRDPAHERQLEAIERSVGAGKKLTRQLLAFSRRQPLLPRVLDLGQLLPSLLDLIRPALGSRVTLDSEVVPGTRCARLDSGELELALINLAVNARDAMPEGGQVHVRVREVHGWVELAFRDTGSGIAAQDLERVFEPFFTTKPVGLGTGLGLAQVYGLCARAGGSAHVESAPGAGTTVTLRFPAVEAPAEDTGDAPARAPTLQALALRVLLVEDNLDIASATRELLQAAGCEVVHVPQPSAALGLLAEDARFDVVLSDIVMPGGMDGLELANELRRRHPQLPIVLMTGYAEKLGEAESQGLVVLPKPFDPALLLRTLREQVRHGDFIGGLG